MISVKRSAGDEWMVSVQGAVMTHHRVRVTKADFDRLSEGRSPEVLLEESFRFLLERESNTSILGSFCLPVIGRYFPEYEREIRTRLRQSSNSSGNPALDLPGVSEIGVNYLASFLSRFHEDTVTGS